MRDTYGAKVQGVFEAGDDVLDLLARQKHATVVHWWGRRIEGAKARAVCYVCDSYVAQWAAKWPITQGAIDRILRHRREHLATLAHHSLADRGTS